MFFLQLHLPEFCAILSGQTYVPDGDIMLIQENLSVQEKLKILTDAAKYDVACTSSGVRRKGKAGSIGNTSEAGICHSFSADGRCISLLKILFTNQCIYDCKYCVNRCSNDVVRTAFTPDEVCKLTIEFYRRNYIEGLFLSSGILYNANHTMELIYETLHKLRNQWHFNGYIHVKTIPGAAPELVERMHREGHLIGNHTYSHIQLTKQNREQFKEELIRTNGIISGISGGEIVFVRPPYGSWDKKFEEELNMFPVLWSIDPLDWCTKDADNVARRVLAKAKENAVILMHDEYDSSVQAAFMVVDALMKEGYEFVTVEEILFD